MPRSPSLETRRAGIIVRTAAWASLAALLLPGSAFAHPLIDEARAQADRAEFEAALDTLTRAETEGALSRDEVVALYWQRALAHFALQMHAAMVEDLRRVAALAPEFAIEESVPPGVRDAFPRAAQRLSLEVRATPAPDGVRLRVDIHGLAPELVQEVDLATRREARVWRHVRARETVVVARPGDLVEYYAEGIGPGGAVLVATGSDASPGRARLSGPAHGAAGAVAPSAPRHDEAGGGSTAWWLAGTAVVAVAAVVTVVMLTGTGGGDTQLSAPTVAR